MNIENVLILHSQCGTPKDSAPVRGLYNLLEDKAGSDVD